MRFQRFFRRLEICGGIENRRRGTVRNSVCGESKEAADGPEYTATPHPASVETSMPIDLSRRDFLDDGPHSGVGSASERSSEWRRFIPICYLSLLEVVRRLRKRQLSAREVMAAQLPADSPLESAGQCHRRDAGR